MQKPFKIRHSAPLVSAIETLIATKTIKGGLGRTLQAIAIHWSPKGQIFPSQQRLADLTGIDRRTIVTHIEKLREMGAVKTMPRPNIVVNGQQVRQTMIYVIVESFIGELFNKARAVLKEAAKKKAQKDHLAPSSKDHTNRFPYGTQGKDRDNTVLKAAQVFLQKRLEAIQSELNHLGKLAVSSAYKAAVKKNKIARGEVLTDEEKARRDAIAKAELEKLKPLAKINKTVQALEKALITWNATKTGFTDAMYSELAKHQDRLSTMGKLIFNKYRPA